MRRASPSLKFRGPLAATASVVLPTLLVATSLAAGQDLLKQLYLPEGCARQLISSNAHIAAPLIVDRTLGAALTGLLGVTPAEAQTYREDPPLGAPHQRVLSYTFNFNCNDYANRAVDQQYLNLDARCGFRGVEWSNKFHDHYNWCVAVSPSLRGQHTEDRDRRLQRCRPGRWQQCDTYAKEAVKLEGENQLYGCRYTGPRWSKWYYDHYRWCFALRNQQNIWPETKARLDAIAQCKAGRK